MKYEDRIAVVTGAGSGIGRALTLALTRRGAQVAAADIDTAGLAQTESACRPGAVTTYRVDVADRAAVLAFADQVKRDLGPASLVFNNAGVDLVAGIAEMSWDDFDWLTGINIGGVISGTKAFLPQLIESGRPDRPARLVNISSAFGLIAVPYQGAYATSKFAVRGFTETLRQELIIDDRPVTAHCVHPGVIRTNFNANMRTSLDEDEAGRFRRVADRAALTGAEKAADAILRGVDKNRGRILVGPDGYAVAAMARLLGARYSAIFARLGKLQARN
ncbi:SDR family NAD(P)-dependent oxidoreductase [Mycobacterium sp. TNTM28]|uniref:SDR family NAD(P)-dependent oxidoreductase n=1 Tax=[Mycobacterium] fortunisiensis TaxID=2600579 RepID=A0ABS6KKW5_9MYCO|nr:SDR family NAD(P)-dependent oxidoreductase [[Mycobacterium] fortunisiensis]MBU9764219.1 SDR family NAD(P)-dependent oxidoreductase [[Mycobacterium] fortunisiensis]